MLTASKTNSFLRAPYCHSPWKMASFFPRPHGFSVIEILIALVISTILLIGVVGLFISSVKSSRESLSMVQLHHELRTVMTRMANHIRRAGYWALAHHDVGSGANNNPFMAADTDLRIHGGNDCILLAYDFNKDGTLPPLNTSSGDERYGYRLNNQTIQSRPASAAFDCTASAASWDTITDPNIIAITALSFTATNKVIDLDGTGSGTSTLTIRDVVISITGQLANDSAVSKTLTQTVRVRNDLFTP